MRAVLVFIGVVLTVIGFVWFIRGAAQMWDKVTTAKIVFETQGPAWILMAIGGLFIECFKKEK